jgi:threonylcarbamoyladenosine tRNA methylthiotransferase MtaB
MNLIKTVAFYTLGCKVNQYETDSMKKKFEKNGIEVVEFDEKADIYIVNTCTVTNIADRKTRNILRRAKKNNPKSILVATGCYAQTDKEVIKEIEEVDIILGNQEKKDLYDIVTKRYSEKNYEEVHNIFDVKKYEEMSFSACREMSRAYIKIQDGCNNFCSYCKIPFARGRNRSRNLISIREEVKNLAKEGFKEIILIGINLGAYGEDLAENISLEDVIEEVSKYDEIKRIRLGSVYPDKISDRFIEMMKKNNKLMPHLHLSLQSGDDEILAGMNRIYNTKYVKEVLKKIRKNVKDIVFTGDVIVGFPGEKEKNFENTYEFIKEIKFSDLHIFKYSDRENTKAATYKNKVKGEDKKKRAERLEKLREEMYNEVRQEQIGKQVEILVEEILEGEGIGYTKSYLKAKIVDYKGSVNNIEKVLVKEIKKGMLICEKKGTIEKTKNKI